MTEPTKYLQFTNKRLFSKLIGKKLLFQNIYYAGAAQNIAQQMPEFGTQVNPEYQIVGIKQTIWEI